MTKTTSVGIRAALVRGKQGAGRPYAESARREVVALLVRRRREGVGVAGVAAEIGLSATTLRKWQQGHASPSVTTSPFREVAIVADTPALRTAVVHGPCGLRIEGLTVTEIAELVRRLG
jgi:transposase